MKHAAGAFAAAFLFAACASAADLTVMSGNGAKAAVRELCTQFEKATGNRIDLRFDVNADVIAKAEAGASFDMGKGASGIYFVGLLDRLGIKEPMQSKLKPTAAEDTVEVVARGDADMVVVVATRIPGVPGVDYAGPIPKELQTKIGFPRD